MRIGAPRVPPPGRRWSVPRPLVDLLLVAAVALGIANLVTHHHGSAGGGSKSAVQPPPASPTRTQVLPAIADTYLNADQPTVGYSRAVRLRVDGQPLVTSLVQFDLRAVRGRIRDATLRLFAMSPSTAGYQVRVAHLGPLDPSKLTYGSDHQRPSGAVAFSGAFQAGSWATADVATLIQDLPRKIVTLAITTSSPRNITFASMEAGNATHPQLVVHSGKAIPVPAPSTGGTAVVLAAGDIASCESRGDEATATLLRREPRASVITLGDDAYETGSAEDFGRCYAPSWGAVKDRTHPAVGNHEYLTSGAGPYFDYFGAAAGERGRGYYSFDLGDWHLVALNSNCAKVGGCGEGSPQERWLRQDLVAHPARCTLAYWHHPRFSSGVHGDFESMEPIWSDLEQAEAELVLSGHDHDYERFAPQTAAGTRDDEHGIREFVVGTGGKNHRPFETIVPNSEVRNTDSYGVLELTLAPQAYRWRFLAAGGSSFTDSGSGACH